jgi:predicted KAP-like P-loop ATPase
MKSNEVNSRIGLLVDEPISSPEEDRLNRVQFAEHLADVLFEHEDSKCLIAAINGEWGCGKSSILNLIEGYLVKKRGDVRDIPIFDGCLVKKRDNRDIAILRFNPWNASDVEQLTAMFFRELKISIIGLDKKQKAKENIGKLLDIFSGILTVGKLSPVGNQYFEMGSALTKKVSGILKDTAKKTQEEIKRQLDQMLQDYAKRIFIIIDDIDRLDIDAMRLLFRLVRLNANFENTTYLLAFDRNLVEHVLECEQPGHGKEYLDKIVQVPINVPSPDEGLITAILLRELDKFIEKLGEKRFDRKHWEELYLEGHFRKYFKSIRNVVRYVNGLEITYPLVSSEVDMVDFMGLNLIRTFAPLSYEMIRKNKEMLTEGGVAAFSAFGRSKSNEVAKEILASIYNFPSSVEGESQEEKREREKEKELGSLVQSTCRVLFPKISSIEGNYTYGGDWEREWRQKRRVCSRDYFDKYFMLGTPVHEISDEEMRLFITMTRDASVFHGKFLEFFDRGMGRRLLEKMEDYVSGIDEESIESVIVSIFNAEERIVGERRQMLTMDSSVLACRIVYRLLLEGVQETDRRKQIIINAIEKCRTILLPVEFISHIEVSGEDGESTRILLELTKSDLEEIKGRCVEKIKSFIKENRLSKAPNLSVILYRWKGWENIEVVKEYVSELISTDEGLWDFLAGFMSEVLSTSGNYKVIHQKSVNEFADFNDIDQRVQEIVAREGSELTEKQKEVVGALEHGKRKDLRWD